MLTLQANPLYYPQLQEVMTYPQTVGIIGGRPSSSLYFLGFQGQNLLYLDPHHVQVSACVMGQYQGEINLKRSVQCILHDARIWGLPVCLHFSSASPPLHLLRSHQLQCLMQAPHTSVLGCSSCLFPAWTLLLQWDSTANIQVMIS